MSAEPSEPSVYVPVHRPRRGGKTSELKAMEEDVQIATIAQFLHRAEKQTTSFTHNLGFHRDIAKILYASGVRFVPEAQSSDAVAPADLPGETEVRPRHTAERVVEELRRRASFPSDVPERAYLIGIRFLFTEAADWIERLQRGR